MSLAVKVEIRYGRGTVLALMEVKVKSGCTLHYSEHYFVSTVLVLGSIRHWAHFPFVNKAFDTITKVAVYNYINFEAFAGNLCEEIRGNRDVCVKSGKALLHSMQEGFTIIGHT